MNITAFRTRDALMAATAERVADALRDGIAKNGKACAALSGGSTPEPAYRALAAMPLDWAKITFALVDERFVPPDHEASNEGMLRRALGPALSAGATLEPMYRSGANALQAAGSADAAYAKLHLDIALMGMGEDGHTASWFPGSPGLIAALDPTNPRTVMALTAPQAAGATERLTLTRAALARADRVLLLITGEAKRARLEAALADATAPVASLFTDPARAPEVAWSP